MRDKSHHFRSDSQCSGCKFSHDVMGYSCSLIWALNTVGLFPFEKVILFWFLPCPMTYISLRCTYCSFERTKLILHYLNWIESSCTYSKKVSWKQNVGFWNLIKVNLLEFHATHAVRYYLSKHVHASTEDNNNGTHINMKRTEKVIIMIRWKYL